MYLIDASQTEWFPLECADGETYVVIKEKNLFDLPKVDAEPVRHGEWKQKYWKPGKVTVMGMLRCSECGRSFWRITGAYFHFCPNCGVQMDECRQDADQTIQPQQP